MTKPRILHLAKWYPHPGDIQNGVFIQNQIQACKSIADQAVLYWGTENEHYWEYENENAIPTIRMYFEPGKRFQNLNRKWGSIRTIIEEAWDGQNPDIIHLHIADNDQYIILEYARTRRIPVVLTEHWSGYLDGRFEAKGAIATQLTQSLFKKVNEVTTVSNFLADAIIEKTGRKDVTIVPNVLDLHQHLSSSSEAFPLSFAMLCDLDDEIKNVSGTIHAFRAFVEKHTAATLHIIGGGKDSAKLEALVKEFKLDEKIQFYGRQNHEKSLELLNQSETVIINSRRETFSVVTLEAIALGKKLICTRCGGPETFLSNDVVLWTRVDDDIDLLEKMEESITWNAPSEETRMKQVEPYLPETIASQWQAIYNRLSVR